jgi:diguanylate cyclase (GGDEF)-like protein
VLVEFAQRLRGAVRITDTVVRIAGDEFVVVFEAITEPLEPDVLGQKIVDAMTTPMLVDGVAVQVSTSVGICAGATVGSSVADFIKLADAALYRSKQEGRGRYSVHWVGGDAPAPSAGEQVQGAGQRP